MIVKTDRQDIEPLNKTGKFSQPPSNNRVFDANFRISGTKLQKSFLRCTFSNI